MNANALLYRFMFIMLIVQARLSNAEKIAVISLHDERYKTIGYYSDLNKRAYAQKHGYDVHLYTDSLDTTRPAAWSKIKALERHLKDYTWLCWIDADALVMNHDIKLESFIDNNYNMIISQDPNGICTGVFLLKNTEWSFELLKAIYNQTQFIEHYWYEQASLMFLLNRYRHLNTSIKFLTQRALNSYIHTCGVYQPGDFIIHFVGGLTKTLQDKEKLIKEFYAKSIVLNT